MTRRSYGRLEAIAHFFVVLDVVLLLGAILFQPFPVEGDREDLVLAALIEAKPVTVLDQFVFVMVHAITKHGLHEDEGLLFELFVVFLNVAWIELISV